jgi:hypothetical protein
MELEVYDGNRVSVSGLNAAGFEVFENGVRQDLRSVQAEAVPYNILVLIACAFPHPDPDRNTWWYWPPILPDAVASLAALLGTGDRLAVGVFRSRVSWLIDWDGQPRARPSPESCVTVNRLPDDPDDSTYYSAMEWAAAEVGRFDGPKAVLVISFHEDSTSREDGCGPFVRPASCRRRIEALREADVPFFVVGLFPARYFRVGGLDRPLAAIPDQPSLATRFRSAMETLPDITSGDSLFGEYSDVDIEDLTALYERMDRKLRVHRYTLTYVPDDPAPDGTYREIEVRLVGEAAERGRTIRQLRDGFPDPSASAPLQVTVAVRVVPIGSLCSLA